MVIPTTMPQQATDAPGRSSMESTGVVFLVPSSMSELEGGKHVALEAIMEDLAKFIRRTFNVPESDTEFTYDVHLFDYGYVDSFGAATLITFIESHFGVRISNQDLVVHPLNTIREISTLIADRRVER